MTEQQPTDRLHHKLANNIMQAVSIVCGMNDLPWDGFIRKLEQSTTLALITSQVSQLGLEVFKDCDTDSLHADPEFKKETDPKIEVLMQEIIDFTNKRVQEELMEIIKSHAVRFHNSRN